MMLSDVCLVCLSVAYIGPKSRTERPRKTKIGTEVAHVTRDSDTTFKVSGQGHRGGANCGGLPPTACCKYFCTTCMHSFYQQFKSISTA